MCSVEWRVVLAAMGLLVLLDLQVFQVPEEKEDLAETREGKDRLGRKESQVNMWVSSWFLWELNTFWVNEWVLGQNAENICTTRSVQGPGLTDEQILQLCQGVVTAQISQYAASIRAKCVQGCPINNRTLIGPPGVTGPPGSSGKTVSWYMSCHKPVI